MSRRRKCVFNDELQQQYSFIKKTDIDSKVRCSKCMATFSIANGGKLDIQQHLRTNKHKDSDIAAASSKTLSCYFGSKDFNDSKRKICISEGTWAYHAVNHNHSFRSNDCTSKLIRSCFDERYSSGRTKCESIVCKVLAPNSIKEIENDLHIVNLITIFCDCSNHGNIKICPILIRYFVPLHGIQVKILEVDNLPGESSDILTKYICDLLIKFNVNKKLLALCADNTNCNFGGAARRGKNNVFKKLHSSTENVLIGVNCAAHILNNCIQTSTECLPIDIETIIVKIFSYFYIYTVRVEELKVICDTIEVEYKKLLGFSKTRWLTLKPSIERILKLFKPLKEYFLSQPKCPTILKSFFEDPVSEAWLFFVHCQATLFHDYITQIESQKICMTEVSLIINELKFKISQRKEEKFFPIAVKKIIIELSQKKVLDINEFKSTASQFYANCIEYLNQWDTAYQEVEILKWVLLRETPAWEDVESSFVFIMDKRNELNINNTELFDELALVKRYTTSEKLKQWNENKKSAEERWVEVFKHFKEGGISFQNILKVVEFSLCLPGSNAPTERVFSILNNIWTSEKAQLKVNTLKSILITKYNYDLNCLEFKEYLKSNEGLLKQIYSAEKYQI